MTSFNSTSVFPTSTALAVEAPAARPETVQVAPIEFVRETLPNGLRVIYAPMTNAPVVHVRVLYHVGSVDEAADRNGFAHMFEHMMFRGSANVPSEQHMKLIQRVGGVSNAFTSFDQTTYINTVPTNHLEMALWLEADRMASFKVSGPVYNTERLVVAEEWRLRTANPPYGTFSQDLWGLAFKTHNYRWTPIGDMMHLANSRLAELQAFHDTYYVPNNATLIIAGQFDVEQAKKWVHDYYGWIARGNDIVRVSKPEPEQTEPRELIAYKDNIPLTRIALAWKNPEYSSDDHLALDLIGTIVGQGRSSRLYSAMVGNENPLAANASAGNNQLDGPAIFSASCTVLPGKDPTAAVDIIKQTFNTFIKEGPTQEELDKARTLLRLGLVQSRQTAESVASILGEEEVFGNDASRVNTVFAQLDALTPTKLQEIAAKYIKESSLTVVQYRPTEKSATQPTTQSSAAATSKPSELMTASAEIPLTIPAATEATPSSSRPPTFPDSYPKTAPINDSALTATFNKGTPGTVNGVEVITLTDARLPIVSFQLIMRGGGHAQPDDKFGVAGLTAAMLTRGSAGKTAVQFATELESRGVSVSADDDGDSTRISGFAPVDQLDFAIAAAREVLFKPDFPADEFARLKNQSMSGLMQQLSNPAGVADRTLGSTVYASLPVGRLTTPQTLAAVTIDDVKEFYKNTYQPKDAVLVFGGAVTSEQGQQLAAKLLDGWKPGAAPKVAFGLPGVPDKRKIILIDAPRAKQATIRMGIPAYTLKSEDRFAGSIAGQVLSAGIDARLNRVLRAEKGLTYGASGAFRPTRFSGHFEMRCDTKPETVGEAITSSFGVFEKMREAPITPEELADARQRVAGQMVLETQTVNQQVGRRIDTILNGYPVDYYDHYAEMIAAVDAEKVKSVMYRYVDNDRWTIIVSGPASVIKSQLDALGEVTVIPMPSIGK